MVLVDTDIASFFFENTPQARVYEPVLLNQTRALSIFSFAELCRWPIERRFGEERTRKLENYLRNFVILPCDEAVARAWAALTPALKLRGVGFSHIDSWIAATALCHKLPLVTHNRKHFENIPGLRLIP